MAVNLTLFPTEAPAVVWFENGDSQAYDPQQENSLQLPSGSVCTISSTAGSEESDEHNMTPEERALAFAERMLNMWSTLFEKARSEVKKAHPQATPV
jgi:hypothetical protein